MKIPLLLIIAASVTIIGCSSSSYPDSRQYPQSRQYPSGSDRYPYPTYPSNNGRNGDLIVTRDGRVLDRNGRIVGTTRNVPSNQGRQIYGSRQGRPYYENERRRNERYNNRRNDERYEKEYRGNNNRRNGNYYDNK
ncbi:hypothetical protein [Segetibacter aerophilus]|uniref:Lipoprotein n=1 Tax=Segetibacter aerophilus TaxID=670293 RepID=A0A512B6P3_9BACT|nr:hypothetical protein [Segetibacter aerophilus]GEO07643.1 hypothetical protein SAE01_01390 [Segetibacter aerophilus]